MYTSKASSQPHLGKEHDKRAKQRSSYSYSAQQQQQLFTSLRSKVEIGSLWKD